MNSISVCMVVKNEEKNIAKCLDCLKFADEVILVDTGSKDKTVEIASKYPNVKIFRKKFNSFFITNLKLTKIFRFADARNYSISKATKDWIFILDADERIHNVEGLKKLINDYPEVQAWYCIQVSVTFTGHRSPCKTTRLWRNGLGVKYGMGKGYDSQGHETPDSAIGELGLKRGDSDLEIEHWGFHDRNWAKTKVQRVIDLLEYGKHPFKNYYLGISYTQIQEIEKAIEYFNKAIFDNMPFNIMAHAHLMLAELYRQFGEFHYTLADERIDTALKLVPDQNLAHLIKADMYKFKNQRHKAIQEYKTIFNRNSEKSILHQDVLLQKDYIEKLIKETKQNGIHTDTRPQ